MRLCLHIKHERNVLHARDTVLHAQTHTLVAETFGIQCCARHSPLVNHCRYQVPTIIAFSSNPTLTTQRCECVLMAHDSGRS